MEYGRRIRMSEGMEEDLSDYSDSENAFSEIYNNYEGRNSDDSCKPNIDLKKKSVDDDGIHMYTLVNFLPETKTTCEEMRDKSLQKLYQFVRDKINIIEQTLKNADHTTFSCDVKIDIAIFDVSTVKKIKKILKWFYTQRKFSVTLVAEDDILTLTIDWGNFKFLT